MDEVKKSGVTVDGHKLVMTFIFVAVTAVIFLGIGFMAGKNSAGTSEVTVLSEPTTTVTATLVGTPTASASESATASTVNSATSTSTSSGGSPTATETVSI